jgi:hypothetical protein
MFNKFTDKGSKYSSFWRSSFDTKSIFDDFDSSEDKPKKKGKDIVQLAAHRRAIANFVRICTSQDIPVQFTSGGDSYLYKEYKGYGMLTYWECECLCGKIVKRTNKTLKNKNYSSCGCKNSLGERRKGLRLFCGVGVNDADYRLSERVVNPDGTVHYTWRCPFYEVWSSMLKRCYSSTYKVNKGRDPLSSVCEEWLTFSCFKKWMQQQEWRGKCLDKDLLVLGNKTYSPTKCTFVSNRINCFFNKCSAEMSPSYNKIRSKYHARIQNPLTGVEEFLGYTDTQEGAISLWLERKTSIAKNLAKEEEGLHPKIQDILNNKELLCQYLNIPA